VSQRKIEQVVTQTWKRTIVKCDLCGLETRPGEDWPTKGYHNRDETCIECKVGSVWPDGSDDRTHYRLDLCPACFVEKFVPAVEKTLGVVFDRGGT